MFLLKTNCVYCPLFPQPLVSSAIDCRIYQFQISHIVGAVAVIFDFTRYKLEDRWHFIGIALAENRIECGIHIEYACLPARLPRMCLCASERDADKNSDVGLQFEIVLMFHPVSFQVD